MNFEVHLNYDGSNRTLSIESGRIPGSVGQAVTTAAMALLDLLCDENHTARVAVSGQIADEGVETRAANSIHVSVYLGPEVESGAPGEPWPDDMAVLHPETVEDIRATATALQSSSADDYPGGPQKYGDDQARVLKAMNEHPDKFSLLSVPAADDIEDIPEEPPANPGPVVPPTPPGGTPGPTRG